jgi:hypothetical protein
MARYAAAWRAAGAGSATLPMASLYAQATGGLWLAEVGVTNTTVTALSIALKRLTTLGTVGATVPVLVYEENDVNVTTKGIAADTHTVGPTMVTGAELRRASIGASIGSGIIWTFGGRGLFIPSGTANGVGLVPITGTGQVCDVYFSWDA